MHLDRSRFDILRDLKKLITEFAEVEQVTLKGPASETARYYIEIKEFYEQLHDVTKELTKLKDQMAYVDVPSAFEREGTSTLTTKEGYRVTISALVRASTKDMATGIEWCKRCECGHEERDHGIDGQGKYHTGACQNGPVTIQKGVPTHACPCLAYSAPNSALVKETINAQTLAAFARSEMEEGRELPDDIFTIQIGQNTSVTKVK
jgi:hypothetical protein